MIRTKSTRRRLPAPGLVVAIVALVAALAGSAVALPGKNSVDGNDLRRGVVKTKNIKKNAVTRSKIKPGAVNGSRVADESLTGADVAEESLAGPLLRGFTTDTDDSGEGTGTRQAFATCPAGTVLLGGGGRITGDNGLSDYALTVNLPITIDEEGDPARQFFVQAEDINGAGGDNDVYRVLAYATCAQR
jgi:hypothetical protein